MNEIPLVAVRHMSQNLDGLRVPLNATERGERPGSVPYWGANAIVDWVDEPLVSGPLVLVGEDGAPFLDRLRPVAFALDEPIWPNNHIHVLRPRPGVDYRYLAYALNSVDYAQHIEGSTRDKLTQSSLSAIKVPGWSADEQRKIADYLDHETADIDAFIVDLLRARALLDEHLTSVRDVLFGSYVTGATRAELRGKLFEVDVRAGKDANATDLLTVSISNGVTRRSEWAESQHRADDLAKYKIVDSGDLILNRMRAFQGAVGVAPQVVSQVRTMQFFARTLTR